MVNTPRKSSASSESIQSLLDTVAKAFAPAEADAIRRACEFAAPYYDGKADLTGTPLIKHALGAAAILAGMNMDYETITATILHAVPEYLKNWQEQVAQDFGANVKMLVEGISRMEHIRQFSEVPGHGKKNKEEAAEQIESLRKMLLAMVEDIRVVLIKLAERTQTLRHLSGASAELQKLTAQQTQGIFAPLANRLGVWQLKWELEDLSVRYLEPELYKKIAKQLDERRADRERYIADVVSRLEEALNKAGIPAEVTGRPKHIYSIINKMKRKHLDFSELYDVRAVRILVGDMTRRDEVSGAGMSPSASSRNLVPRSNVPEADENKVDGIRGCYTALGLVHELWPPIESEFDDYIAHPKSNNYRSLHTAVIGPRGLALEVQIRTREMHQHSELGVAAHWRYKEGARADKGFDAKIAWLRSLLEWKDEIAEAADFVDQFKSEVFSERVYVFTPKGNIVDLPAGATPLDFAYDIHTDVGHRCRGAKVNGQMVPLTYPLKTGDRVEVLTVKQGGPSRDWLSPHLGYLHTSKARTRVSHWFRDQNYDTSVAEGRAALEREFHRLGISDINYEKLAQRFGYHRVDDFLAATGRGDVKPAQIMAAVQEFTGQAPKEAQPVVAPRPPTAPRPPASVTIQGVGNLLTRMAKCCNPVPGDSIVGFITRGQGVTIHRQNCPNALRHHDEHNERLIEVSWGADTGRSYPVDVEILAYDRAGLLRDITSLLANEKINVLGVSTVTDKQQVAHMTFTLDIPNIEILSRILALLDQIPNVTEVRRRAH